MTHIYISLEKEAAGMCMENFRHEADAQEYGNGLFIRFCDSNHEVTRMQQEKEQQHQRATIKFLLMKYKISES